MLLQNGFQSRSSHFQSYQSHTWHHRFSSSPLWRQLCSNPTLNAMISKNNQVASKLDRKKSCTFTREDWTTPNSIMENVSFWLGVTALGGWLQQTVILGHYHRAAVLFAICRRNVLLVSINTHWAGACIPSHMHLPTPSTFEQSGESHNSCFSKHFSNLSSLFLCSTK